MSCIPCSSKTGFRLARKLSRLNHADYSEQVNAETQETQEAQRDSKAILFSQRLCDSAFDYL